MDRRYTIKELILKGIVSPTVAIDIEVADKVKVLRHTGMTKGAAVRHVAKELGCTVQRIYKGLVRTNLD